MFILKVLLIRTFGGCEMPHHIYHTCKRSSVHHIFHHSLGIHTPAVFHASSRDRRQFTNQCLFGYKELRNEQQRRWFSFRTFISTHAKPGNSRRSLSSYILHLYLSMFSRLWDHTCIYAFVSLRTFCGGLQLTRALPFSFSFFWLVLFEFIFKYRLQGPRGWSNLSRISLRFGRNGIIWIKLFSSTTTFRLPSPFEMITMPDKQLAQFTKNKKIFWGTTKDMYCFWLICRTP